jgi:hypothetical protein
MKPTLEELEPRFTPSATADVQQIAMPTAQAASYDPTEGGLYASLVIGSWTSQDGATTYFQVMTFSPPDPPGIGPVTATVNWDATGNATTTYAPPTTTYTPPAPIAVHHAAVVHHTVPPVVHHAAALNVPTVTVHGQVLHTFNR